MPHLSTPWLVSLAILAVLVVSAPWVWRTYGRRMQMFAGGAYQKNMITQLKKKYPLVAARMDGYDLGEASQASFQTAMKRLPPQKAMELQTEFNRLREHFMTRHPELAPFLDAGQDPKAQLKAFNQLLAFPETQRQTIEKDLIWAWDQLRGRYPALMGPLEAALKKKAEVPATPAKS